jgi:predicted aminopeptidase
MSWRRGLIAAALLLVVGCQSLSYYTQAIGGHLRVMSHARPIADWLADPNLDPQLRHASRPRAASANSPRASSACRTTAATSLCRARPSVGGVERVRRGEFSVEPKADAFPSPAA